VTTFADAKRLAVRVNSEAVLVPGKLYEPP
jgi:hypothetical protein